MQTNDQLRLKSLYKQRLLEIKRSGVYVSLYHRHQILPAFIQCSKTDYLKFKSIVCSNVSLELCNDSGVPLMKIPKKQYFIRKDGPQDKYRVYLNDKNKMRKYQEGYHYVLVINNATIGVLSSILQERLNEQKKYFKKIEDFIGDENCVKIDMNEDQKLEYEYQLDLNIEQNEAIQKSFNNHLTFVKGPPGCGKSKTVARMVRMMAQRGRKILVGSISNVANETLINQIVREVQDNNKLCEQNSKNNKLRKLNILINYSNKALQKINQQVNKFTINQQLYWQILWQFGDKLSPGEKDIRFQINKLQKGQQVSNSFFAFYMKCYNDLVGSVNIVISTTINSFKLYRYSENFKPDVGVLDEAAQASWTDTYGFLAFGVQRMIFVGDQMQLRPTVIGDATGNKILKDTMFEKLAHKNKDYFVHLIEQYRMHPKISEFPNLFVYSGKLKNSEITLTQRQSTIDYFKQYPMSFVTHDFQQNVFENIKTIDDKKGKSEYSNIHEGSLIMDLLFLIPKTQWRNVGILTFYDMQRQVLIHNLREQISDFDSTGLSVKTIDGYQGGQKDYIIISTVRSNPQKNPGFCTELNRVNVALTRAKRGLVVFGNPETLTQGNQFEDKSQNIWCSYYQYMLKENQVLTCQQFHLTLGLKQVQLKSVADQKSIKKQKTQQVAESHCKIDVALLSKFYQSLTLLISTFQSLKIQQNDQQLLQNNAKYRKQAKTLIGEMKKINKQTLQEQQISLKQKIENYLSIEALQKANNKKNNKHEKQQDKKDSLQQKFVVLAKQCFTQKQYEFSLSIINFLSSTLHEIMSKNPENIDVKQILTLRECLNEEKQKLTDLCWVEFKEDITSQNLKNLSALKETQKLKTLVSLKLKFKVLLECSKEIEKLISCYQAPMNNKF